jgi:DNA repair protein RecO (recombination protein O)
VTLRGAPSADLLKLTEADLDTTRIALTSSIERLEAASHALRWLRFCSPQRMPEPQLFHRTELLLDTLILETARPKAELAAYGFALLALLGFELNFTSCVSCAKPCPESQAAYLHPARGGLVCRSCGGGPLLVSAELRSTALQWSRLEGAAIPAHLEEMALSIAERALGAHMGVD